MSTAITATGEKPLTSAALRELSARSNLPGAVRAVNHYGAIGVFGTLIWLVSSTGRRHHCQLRLREPVDKPAGDP